MTDVLLLTNQGAAASQAPPTPAVEQKPRHGIKGERRGGTATRSRVLLFLGARGLLCGVCMFPLCQCGTLNWPEVCVVVCFYKLVPCWAPVTTESGTQEWWGKEKERQWHEKVWNDWRQIELVCVCQVFVRAVACFTLDPVGPDSLSRSVLSKNCLQLSR